MRYSFLSSRPCRSSCPGRLMMRSSFGGFHHRSRQGSRASPSRRSGRAPRALPWRSSPARSRASPLVDATLRVRPPGGVSQLRGRLETRGGCRSARTGTSSARTSHPICGSRRRCPLALLVQRKGVKLGLNAASFQRTAASGPIFKAQCFERRVLTMAGGGGRPISTNATHSCPGRCVASCFT